MKRVISIFVAVVSVLTIMISAVSCSAEEFWTQMTCEHKYDTETITVDPTCSAEGEKELTCSICGYVDKEKVEKSAHEYEVVPAKEATCRETGLTDYKKCIECGFVEIEPTVIPVKGHTIAYHDAVKATCLENGLTQGKYCTVCDEVFEVQQYISPLGHSLVVVKGTPATCEKAGLTDGVFCENCDVVYNEQVEIPAVGHKDLDGDAICDVCNEEIYDELLAMYNSANVIERDAVEGETFTEPFVLRLYRRTYVNELDNECSETYVGLYSEAGGSFYFYLLVEQPEQIFLEESNGNFVSIAFTGEFAYIYYGTHVDFYIGNQFSVYVTVKESVLDSDYNETIVERVESKVITGEKSFSFITPASSGNIKILSLPN